VAALAEAEKLTAAQLSVPFAKKPPPSAFDLLAKAQLFGMERPPMLLRETLNNGVCVAKRLSVGAQMNGTRCF
jgi:hypothetical protein